MHEPSYYKKSINNILIARLLSFDSRCKMEILHGLVIFIQHQYLLVWYVSDYSYYRFFSHSFAFITYWIWTLMVLLLSKRLVVYYVKHNTSRMSCVLAFAFDPQWSFSSPVIQVLVVLICKREANQVF